LIKILLGVNFPRKALSIQGTYRAINKHMVALDGGGFLKEENSPLDF
jgi:hypothetical protein